jgi:hypothetical protein
VEEDVGNVFTFLFAEGAETGDNKASFLKIFLGGGFNCEEMPHE